MLKYKIDVLEELKKKGYTSYRLRHEKILGEGDMTKLRNGIVVGIKVIDKLCGLLNCQPGNIIEWVEDNAQI